MERYEYVIREQEKSGKTWNGVPLFKLSKLAQNVYRGKYVTVDEYGFLVLYYTSNSGKANFGVQYELDENGYLCLLPQPISPSLLGTPLEFEKQANEIFFR